MRIVTLVNSLNAGGAEAALLELVAATRDRFEHAIVPLIGGGVLTPRFRALGVRVEEGRFARGSLSVGAFLALARKVRALHPDVLVGWMYHSAAFAAALRALLPRRTPLIWAIHHSLDGLAEQGRSTRMAIRSCRLLSGQASAIVFVSARSAGQHAAFGFPRDRSRVIPNGYDLRRFRPDASERRRLRAEWGFGDDDVVVGHVARVDPMKDHANFLDAFARGIACQPRLAAVLCGLGTDALSLPPSIRPRIRLLGFRGDVAAVMNACDVGCLSSSGEAFPNVLAEFLACGRPCVTTDVGDAAMIVEGFGRVVPPCDPASLAAALVELAEAGEPARHALGLAGRRSILERFDIRNVAEQHVDLWNRAIEAAR